MGSETAGGESRLKKLSVARRVTFALLVSVLLAVVVGAVTISAQAQSVTSDDTALRTLLPADTEVNKLLAELVDQETGERGFVITGENSFLQPYTAGRKDTAGLVATLHHELVLRPTDLGLLAMVVSRYDKWLHKFAVPQIKDVTDGHRSAAVAAEKTGRGKVLFDNLRAGVTALSVRIDTEERSLIADVRSRQAETLWLDVAITVCAVLGAAAGLWLLNRWIIRPIKLLETEVSAVAEGATDHAVVASGPPELLSLGQNVEKMRQRVRDDYDEIRLLRRVSETLQQSVLPSVLATPDRYEIAARYQPGVAGLDVGGDWFNLSDVGGGRVFFAVGDVSGRGLQAASLMAELRYAIKAYAAENPSPEDVLRRVGRYSKLSDHGHFATILCGLFDISAGTVTMASAGHPTPILTNGEEGATVVSMAVGPPIGLNHDAYTSTRLPARRGSTLLVYTDGLVECRTEPITDSIDRLRQAASVNLPLEGLIDHLLASMVPDGARDDIVILGVRWQS